MEILGDRGILVLEYHLRKRVGGDPYQDPEKFLEGLRQILGLAGSAFLEKMLFNRYDREVASPAERRRFNDSEKRV